MKLVDGTARKSTVGLFEIQMSFTRRTIMEVTIIYYCMMKLLAYMTIFSVLYISINLDEYTKYFKLFNTYLLFITTYINFSLHEKFCYVTLRHFQRFGLLMIVTWEIIKCTFHIFQRYFWNQLKLFRIKFITL